MTLMPKTKTILLVPFVFLLLTIFSTPSYSEDCHASTDARALMSTLPELQSEKLIARTGKYSAVLKNGDIVMAMFTTCGLGLSAHYLSVKPLNSNERMAHVKMFLSHILPSQSVVNKVIPQLQGFKGNSFDKAVVLEGLGDQHQVVIKPSPSPLYSLDIQYNWIPPEF